MSSLPVGTVTFLFTDIEGSTLRWEHFPEAMKLALARHDELMRQAIQAHRGSVFHTAGDAFCAVFERAPDALAAAIEAQRALAAEEWGQVAPLLVRMALHTDHAERYGESYASLALNRVSRLLSAGYGGQVLLSQATQELLEGGLPERTTLVDLGEHQLKEVTHPLRIFQASIAGLPDSFPQLKTVSLRQSNLPLPQSQLIGRERERQQVCDYLQQPAVRLITLTGPGGIGKTRLAMQCATDMIKSFEGGVYFVALAPVSEASLVSSTIAQLFGLKEDPQAGLAEALRRQLLDRPTLLILDNFEQVIDAAPLIADLLARVSSLKVLVTSREVLRLRGEQDYAVPPLALPDLKQLPPLQELAANAAVYLFLERAREVRPNLALTAENAPAIAEICARLDGLPLAIELAAAQSNRFAPGELLPLLVYRLGALDGDASALPSRRQTLRETIQWSYNLLRDAERRLMNRLAVFVDGCSLDAATYLAAGALAPGDAQSAEVDLEELQYLVLEGLTLLIDKSLLRREEGAERESRFRMLATIREYALEQLVSCDDAAHVRDLHAAYYLRLAAQAQAGLASPQQSIWQTRLRREYENLRAAIAWSISRGQASQVVELFEQIRDFLFGYAQGEELVQWLEAILASQISPSDRVKALISLGNINFYQNLDESLRCFSEAVELVRPLDDPSLRYSALVELSNTLSELGELAQAQLLFEEILALSRQVQTRAVLSRLPMVGNLALRQGNASLARQLYEESRRLAQLQNNTGVFAWCTMSLGWVARFEGHYQEAYRLLEEAARLYRELGDEWRLMIALCDLGSVALYLGEVDKARAMLLTTLRFYRDRNDIRTVLICLERLGEVSMSSRQFERAARLWGAVAALRGWLGLPVLPDEQQRYAQAFAFVHAELGDEPWERAWAAGGALSLDEALDYATTTASGSPDQA